jgi:hypothetical protein
VVRAELEEMKKRYKSVSERAAAAVQAKEEMSCLVTNLQVEVTTLKKKVSELNRARVDADLEISKLQDEKRHLELRDVLDAYTRGDVGVEHLKQHCRNNGEINYNLESSNVYLKRKNKELVAEAEREKEERERIKRKAEDSHKEQEAHIRDLMIHINTLKVELSRSSLIPPRKKDERIDESSSKKRKVHWSSSSSAAIAPTPTPSLYAQKENAVLPALQILKTNGGNKENASSPWDTVAAGECKGKTVGLIIIILFDQ